MAVAVDLLLNSAQAASSVKEIRQAMKDLKSAMLEVGDEGSEDFKKLARASAEVKDRLEDVNDRIAAFNPDKFNGLAAAARIGAQGIQLATSAMALFGGESEAAQKALMKVQAAMAFSQAISGLKELQKEFKALMLALEANPWGLIAAAIAALSIAVYKAYQDYRELTSESHKLTVIYEKQKEVTAKLVEQYDRELEVLEAQGNKDKEIFEIKKKKIEAQLDEARASYAAHKARIQEIQDNDSIYESVLRVEESLLRKMGADKKADEVANLIQLNKNERAADDIKSYEESVKQINDLKTSLTVLEIKENNRVTENAKKAAKDQREIDDKKLKDHEQYLQAKRQKEQEAYDQEKADREAAYQQAQEERWKDLMLHRQYVEAKQAKEQAAYEKEKARIKAEHELRKKVREQDLQVAAGFFGAMAELSGKHAKLQKAFAAAQTLIETYLAAQKAYTSQILPGDPTSPIRGYIAAAAAVVSGLVRVRAILQTNMDAPGSGSGGASGGSGDGGSYGGLSLVNQAPQGSQPTGGLDADGNVNNVNQQPPPQQVYVLESDIRATQTRVNVIQEATSFR